jgi:hypothetical protein
VSDSSSPEEQSGDGGGLRWLLGPLAVGTAVAATFLAGRKLVERRHRSHDDGGRASGTPAREAPEPPADLETELRGATSELALTLLDRATNRLERAQL